MSSATVMVAIALIHWVLPCHLPVNGLTVKMIPMAAMTLTSAAVHRIIPWTISRISMEKYHAQ
jgi:hypothetical protein